jgi:hypothetical protein
MTSGKPHSFETRFSEMKTPSGSEKVSITLQNSASASCHGSVSAAGNSVGDQYARRDQHRVKTALTCESFIKSNLFWNGSKAYRSPASRLHLDLPTQRFVFDRTCGLVKSGGGLSFQAGCAVSIRDIPSAEILAKRDHGFQGLCPGRGSNLHARTGFPICLGAARHDGLPRPDI